MLVRVCDSKVLRQTKSGNLHFQKEQPFFYYKITLKLIGHNTHPVPSAILSSSQLFCTIRIILVSLGCHRHNPDGSHRVSLSLWYRNAESRAEIITTAPHSAALMTAQYSPREKIPDLPKVPRYVVIKTAKKGCRMCICGRMQLFKDGSFAVSTLKLCCKS